MMSEASIIARGTEIERAIKTAEASGVDVGSMKDELSGLWKAYAEKDRQKRYLRLAGEAEPRLVQARRNLTPEQRGLLYPWEQMDTMLKAEGITGGLDDLIVRYGDDVAASAPAPELPAWMPRSKDFRTGR
jgi:hypothetical protein